MPFRKHVFSRGSVRIRTIREFPLDFTGADWTEYGEGGLYAACAAAALPKGAEDTEAVFFTAGPGACFLPVGAGALPGGRLWFRVLADERSLPERTTATVVLIASSGRKTRKRD